MEIQLAEHIAWFTPWVRMVKDKQLYKILRRERRRRVRRKPDKNKELAID